LRRPPERTGKLLPALPGGVPGARSPAGAGHVGGGVRKVALIRVTA